MERPSLSPARYCLAERMFFLRFGSVMNGQWPGRLALGLVDEVAIAPAKEDQRCRRVGVAGVANDADDEDDVVATIIAGIRFALEMSERARNQRRLGVADARPDLLPLVGEGARELVGDRLLLAGEYVDGKSSSL